MNSLVEVKGLTKVYGRQRGVSGLDFAIPEGEIFGFLGPNGAGKTTTMRLLMGFLQPTGGQSLIAGRDCWRQSEQVKRLVGYLPGEFIFDPQLTGAQILTYLGNLRGGVDPAYRDELVERLGLDVSRRFREYSRGNKQKVGVVQALMHRPRLLILDEPTSGLDPLNQQEFYALLVEAHQRGSTIFLSSHIIPEVERICRQVGIIRAGKLVNVAEVAALKQLRQQVITLTFGESPSADWFSYLPGVEVTAIEGLEMQLSVRGDLQSVLGAAAAHHVNQINTRQTSLEEIFLQYYANDAG